MFVPPTPVGLLVVLRNPVEPAILAMVLLHVHPISTILVVIPMMVIVVVFIVVDTIVIIGQQNCRGQSYRYYQGGAEQRGIQETAQSVLLPAM